MISGGVVGWEKAEDVPCSCLCIMSLYFAYKMIMQGRDAPARYERVASMAPASSSQVSNDDLEKHLNVLLNY